MTNADRRGSFAASPPLVAVVSWLLPGAGYFLIRQRTRGIVIGVTIITMFLSGVLLAGVRVIDVPGYDRTGHRVRIDAQGRRIETFGRENAPDYLPWALTGRGFFAEVVNKPWYVCQVINGPMCLIASQASVAAAREGIPSSHARIYEIGSLYTSIAGLLNLLAIIDAAYRASKLQEAR